MRRQDAEEVRSTSRERLADLCSRHTPASSLRKQEHWGDSVLPRPPNTFRIGFLNIGGFPVYKDAGKEKEQAIYDYILKYEFDVIGMSEMNVNWKSLPPTQRLEERTRRWFEHYRIAHSYNSSSRTKQAHQFGGTSVWSLQQFSSMVMETGHDSTGLGRWTWVRYRGRNNCTIRVISAYRPVLGRDRLLSVWSQHAEYFLSQGKTRDPQEAFLQDLVTDIKLWQESGDLLILGLDANLRLTSTDTLTRTLASYHLVHNTSVRHGSHTPATFARGSTTIDGLFVSQELSHCSSGFLPFATFDHRGTWVDIPYTLALGHPSPPLVRPPARRLKMDRPKVVATYLQELDALLQQRNVYHRAEQLLHSLPPPADTGWDACPFDATQRDTLISLEDDRVWAMILAEKRCRHIYKGQIQWTPELQAIYRRIDYGRRSLRKLQGHRVNLRSLQRLAKRCNFVPPTSARAANLELQAAYAALHSYRQHAIAKRTTFQEQLIAEYEAHGALDAARVVEQLFLREKQRRDFATIKKHTGKMNKGSVSFVLKPGPDGMVTCRTKDSIERACLEENDSRFRLATDTPMLQAPLWDDFGAHGTTDAADHVMQGTYQVQAGTDPYFTDLLPYLRRPPDIADSPIDLSLNVPEHRRQWRRARERTSSGPSGLHFGHYIAGARHDCIGRLNAIMDHIPYRTGFTPPRWRQGINCMLSKGKGNAVGNLRTILLFEADFNRNNALCGRQLMRQAEHFHTLPPEQYGSRKRHSAIDQSLNKRCTYDYWRLMRQPGAHMSGDLQKCYDRIVHSFAALCMSSHGLPKGPIEMMFGTIQELEHRIRTIYGDSTTSFSSDNPLYVVPIQGIGQGNGAGPHIWALVSAPCLKLLYDRGYRCFFTGAISGEKFSLVGYAFVDDYDQVTSSTDPTDPATVAVAQMQQAVELWAGTIRVTGGALEPTKSFWYLIDFQWKNGLYSYKTVAQSPATIVIPDQHGAPVTLRRFETHHAVRTLGCYHAPNGDETKQAEVLCQLGKDWASHIRRSKLPRHLVWLSLHTGLLKSIEYPLPTMTIPEASCYKIIQPVLRTGLSHSGIVNTLARSVVFGPPSLQGLGIPHPYATQGISRLAKLVRFSRSSTITGKQIRCNLELHTLELGLPTPMFSSSYSDFGHLTTPTWLSASWQFCHEKDIRVMVDSPCVRPRCANDRYLIPDFHAHGYSPLELASLNRCRKYLRATTLGDLATVDGRFLSAHAWDGIPLGDRTGLQWPNQGIPPAREWLLWRQAIGTVYGCDGGRRLSTPLNPWYADCSWTYWYSPETDRVFTQHQDRWLAYSRGPQRIGRSGFGKYHDPVESAPPPTLHPATCSLRPHSPDLLLTVYDPRPGRPRGAPSYGPFCLHDLVQDLSPGSRWAFADYDSSHLLSLAQAIQTGLAIGVSDGSFKAPFSTAAWTLQGPHVPDRPLAHLTGKVVVPGSPQDHGAYRAELGGLFSMVIAVTTLCKVYHVTSGSITLACDGESALWKSLGSTEDVDTTVPQFDIITAIRTAVRGCPVRIAPRHVLGHQDDHVWDVLDRWSTINCSMDGLAKATWARHRHDPPVTLEITGAPWAVAVQGASLHCHFRSTLTRHVTGVPLRAYWDQRQRFAPAGSCCVDWRSTADLMKYLSRTRQHWLVKHATGTSATGKVLLRRKEQSSSACPLCRADVEDSTHILRCQDPRVQELWKQGMTAFDDYLLTLRTPLHLREVLVTGLRAWYSSSPTSWAAYDRDVADAALAQDGIGWRSLLEGCPAIGWESCQTKAFLSINSRQTGRRWMRRVLSHLIEFSFSLWQHRNSIQHSKDEDLQSADTNLAIDAEFALGFQGLHHQFRSRISKSSLRASTLPVRQAWLRRVGLLRKILEDQRERRAPPPWVLRTCGVYTWIRHRRPVLPTPALLALYPELHDMASL